MTPQERQEFETIQAFRPTRTITSFWDVNVGPQDLIVRESGTSRWHVLTGPSRPVIQEDAIVLFWKSGQLSPYIPDIDLSSIPVAEPPKVWTKKDWLNEDPFSV